MITLNFQLVIATIFIRLETVLKDSENANVKYHTVHRIVTNVVRAITDIQIANLANVTWTEPEEDSAKIPADNVLVNKISVVNFVINARMASTTSPNANVNTFSCIL